MSGRGNLTQRRGFARILFLGSSGQKWGLGPGIAFVSNRGEGEKHPNWTPEVAFQHTSIRSGLEREAVLVRISRLFHLARGLLSQGLWEHRTESAPRTLRGKR